MVGGGGEVGVADSLNVHWVLINKRKALSKGGIAEVYCLCIVCVLFVCVLCIVCVVFSYG